MLEFKLGNCGANVTTFRNNELKKFLIGRSELKFNITTGIVGCFDFRNGL